MERQWVTYFELGLLTAVLAAGCASPPRSQRAVVVTPTGQVFVPQPVAQREPLMGGPPTDSAAWTVGNWTYHNARWVWLPGHWQTPEQSAATWVSGHWDETDKGWYWTPGHWE